MKTKTKEPNSLWKRGLSLVAKTTATLLALATVSLFVSFAVWPPINDVETGVTPQYQSIQPRAYRFSANRVVSAAAESIEILERFSLAALDEEAHELEATATTPSGYFTNDVTIRVEPNGDGGAIVFIRSRSRVGRGDFGQNARNIEAIQAAMDHNLGIQ